MFNKHQADLAFRQWLLTPLGAHLLAVEAARINSIVPTLFGYNAVILGEPDYLAALTASPIKSKAIVTLRAATCNAPLIRSRLDKLPILSDSVDLVYLAHCLEFASNPHEVLREAYRIMRPDGHILISMFNPFSIWGLWRNFAKFSGNSPWSANFMSLVRLKDWLALLGFDIMRVNHFGYCWPVKKCNTVTLETKAEYYGQKLEVPCGAAYVVEASKRVIAFTPIKPIWTEPEIISDDLAEPTV